MFFNNHNLKFRRCIRRSFLALVTSALCLSATTGQAATLTVTSGNDSGLGTLRQAILDASSSGDTINFAASITTIDLTSGELLIDKNLTITGPGPNLLTIQRSATAAFRIFHIASATITATISGLKIADGKTPGNSSGQGGGGIFNPGNLTLINCTISGNTGNSGAFAGGAGLSNTGLMTITNCTISGNSLPITGGGGLENGGRMTITNSTISGNSTVLGYGGGGIYNHGPLTIINTTISANSSSGGDGGGIYNTGTITITNSTLSANSARYGGGIDSSSSITINNCTVSGNSAPSGGGGIWNPAPGSTVTITNSTITGNAASGPNNPYGGGITNGGSATARNTIIALNTAPAGPDFWGSLTSSNFNLVGNNTDAVIMPAQSSDQIGTAGSPIDPLLGPLQNNGGPTFTHALQSGSTAIDKGHSSGSTTDQRGFTRPVDFPAIPNATGGDGGDIGAYEFGSNLPPATVLGNISTRLRVETGENVLIGGFIVTGTQPKKVIVRAIGPSLTAAGVPGALANPTLELHGPSGLLIASNDNWMDAPNRQEIIDSTVAPTNDLESAILMTLPANNSAYTAIVRGVNDGTGVALVEAYDLDRTVDSKLANISTRGSVQTGNNVMIGGFIVVGQTSQRVIVRAIGPSLSVAGKLADPTLELHDGNGALLQSNDNWRTDQEAEIIATTIPPSNDLESAIVRTLTAGSYTAIVRGVNGTTGVALVEVYALN